MCEPLKKKSSHRYDFCKCQGNPWCDICPEYLVLFALPLFCLSFFPLCLEFTVELIQKMFSIQLMCPLKQNI